MGKSVVPPATTIDRQAERREEEALASAPPPAPASLTREFERAETRERYPTKGDDSFEANTLEKGRDLTRPRQADVTGIKLRDGKCLVCEKSFKSMRARDYCSGTFAKDGSVIPLPGPEGRASCLAELERKDEEAPFHKLICQNASCERAGGVFYAKHADARFCGNTCQKANRRANVRESFLCEAA
jgi:hypothetical protein